MDQVPSVEEAEETLKHVEEATKGNSTDGGGRGEVDRGVADARDPLGATYAVSEISFSSATILISHSIDIAFHIDN